MQDLVSIIVPAYNAEKFLSRCADSVLNQTYKNIELIIINDGSADKTGVIGDQYARGDHRVVVVHQENKGVSAARNAGIDRSRGEYIMFVDADDALVPDAVEMMLSEIRSADADIVACNSRRIRNEEAVSLPQSKDRRKTLEGMESLVGSLQDRGFGYSACAKLFRRDLVGDTRFVEGRRVNEDSFFMFQCFCKQPRMVLRDRYVYLYYVTEDSASMAAFSEKFFDILFFADRKLEIITQQYPQLQDLAYNVIVKANMSLLWNLCKTWDPKFRKAERECIAAVRRYRRYYIPGSRRDNQWHFVICNHLFYCYKIFYFFRSKLKKIM